MKNWKRGAVIVTVLLFVSAAVYLNRAYGKKQEESALAGADAGTQSAESVEDAGIYYTAAQAEEASESLQDKSGYFAQTRLSRSQARDEATQTLTTVSESDGASQETIAEALSQIMTIAEQTTKEAELETLITAKGFQDCVVFLGDDSATVTVWAETEGLSSAETAQITDILATGTGLSASQIKIVEIK